MIFILWIAFSFIVGAIGKERKIGFWGAFFASIFLSPLVGIVITLTSKNIAEEEYKSDVLNLQLKQQEELQKIAEKTNSQTTSISDELYKLAAMREKILLLTRNIK